MFNKDQLHVVGWNDAAVAVHTSTCDYLKKKVEEGEKTLEKFTLKTLESFCTQIRILPLQDIKEISHSLGMLGIFVCMQVFEEKICFLVCMKQTRNPIVLFFKNI